MTQNKNFTIESRQFSYEIQPSKTIDIKSVLGNYQVQFFNEENLNTLNAYLAHKPNNLLVIDEKVYTYYQNRIKVDSNNIFLAKASESFKTMEGIISVLEFLKNNNFNKTDQLIIVGGGTIQDVGSFVAACFKRGVSWIYFPTTLLSMCDSCIGAKSSINFHEAKNQLGLFYPPTTIIINPEFLKTLPQDDVASGIGEALKLFAIAGGTALTNYPQQVHQGQLVNPGQCQNLISTALNIKKAVIEIDEFDQSYRKALNYGHTVGHVLESLSNYQIPHGLSVVIGMLVANELSAQEGYLRTTDKKLIEQYAVDLLTEPTLALIKTINFQKILQLMKKDKKVSGQELTFILLAQPGKVIFKKIILNEILEQKITQVLQQLSNNHK